MFRKNEQKVLQVTNHRSTVVKFFRYKNPVVGVFFGGLEF